ncbi:MAG: hypothetical protein GMKNLPBB_01813 [Myxococcota bacterium]|nr:hypothetical protein [Myxococcota bacterium]
MPVLMTACAGETLPPVKSIAGCSSDNDCSAGQICDNRRCVAAPFTDGFPCLGGGAGCADAASATAADAGNPGDYNVLDASGQELFNPLADREASDTDQSLPEDTGGAVDAAPSDVRIPDADGGGAPDIASDAALDASGPVDGAQADAVADAGPTDSGVDFDALPAECRPKVVDCSADAAVCEGEFFCNNQGKCENGHCKCAGCGFNQTCNQATGLCGNVKPTPCAADADCKSIAPDWICEDKQCRGRPGTCNSDSSCTDPERKLCDVRTGNCIGCRVNADCVTATKKVCHPQKFLCVQCSKDSECLVGERCDSTGTCRSKSYCETNADCNPGFECERTSNRCVEKLVVCLSDLDCQPWQFCDRSLSVCTSAGAGPNTCNPPPWDDSQPGKEGAVCARDSDCQKGLICIEDFVTNRGKCRQACTSIRDKCCRSLSYLCLLDFNSNRRSCEP